MSMTLFDSPSFANHEGVHAVFDEKTGLRAIIAVHSSARGPACGGTRMWNYASSAEALEDVLRLSRGMSYKNAVADLEMGGGKSVIIGDARTNAEIVTPDAIYDVKADIYAPCALGATLNPQTLDRLTVKAVVGAANNQLATPDIGQILFERGVLYAPDYVVNGGGIINVASELRARQTGGAYDAAWVEAKLSRLMDTLEEVLDRSDSEKRPTHEIADAIAEARINAARDLKAEQRKAA